MKVIPREARRITFSTEIRKLKLLTLNDEQKAVVVGSILGDGSLSENWSKTNFRLDISHSIKQRDYLIWKCDKLAPFVLTQPRVTKHGESIKVKTISLPELTFYRNIFYSKRRKIVPKNIALYLINPMSIAVWFMDDGNIVKRNGKTIGFHLNTQSFSKSENNLLRLTLFKIYGIEVTLERNHGKYRLAIWKKISRIKFIKVIEPFILNSLKYKLG